MLGVGVLLLVVSVLLLALSTRDRPARYAGPPPTTPWAPPVPVDRTTAADAQPDTTRSAPPRWQPPSG